MLIELEKIAMPLKCVSSFFRALELPLINTKLYIELNWTEHSVISTVDGNTTFQITKTDLYVPTVTLNTENDNKLAKLLSEDFKRSVIWNEYKSKIETISTNFDQRGSTGTKRTILDTSFHGVKRLFVMGFDSTLKRSNNEAY